MRFTILPPVDVPLDATLTAVRLTTVLLYSNVTHKWSKDAPAVWFLYRRSNGQTFELTADVYDPRTGPPGRYMFEGIDLPGGRTKLIKHEHFEWRNGDQVMLATAGEGITAAEIVAIRTGMQVSRSRPCFRAGAVGRRSSSNIVSRNPRERFYPKTAASASSAWRSTRMLSERSVEQVAAGALRQRSRSPA